jgi:hypothetical protein
VVTPGPGAKNDARTKNDVSFRDVLSKGPARSAVKAAPQQDKTPPQDNNASPKDKTPPRGGAPVPPKQRTAAVTPGPGAEKGATTKKGVPLKPRPPAVTPGPGAKNDARTKKNMSFRDVVRRPDGWITKCAHELLKYTEFEGVTPALRYTKKFIADLCHYFDDQDLLEDARIKYNEIVRNCIECLLSKDTTFKALMLPYDDAEHIEEIGRAHV